MQWESERLTAQDYEQAVEMFFEKNWTDGLPVLLPTEHRVRATLAATPLPSTHEMGAIPPKGGICSIEKLAVYSVMAGCRPEYFPVVVAAMEGILAPEHNISGVTTTTHPCTTLTIVHGPMVSELGFNSRDGVFGNGNRANGTVGRAVRLALWNLGGARPGETDRATHSHPGEWTFCIAENEEESPWPGLHLERGLPPGSNAVTVFACESPHLVIAYGKVREMLTPIVDTICTVGNNNVRHGAGQLLIVLNPITARAFHEQGWGRQDLQQYVWAHARKTVAFIKSAGLIACQVIDHLKATRATPPWVDWDNPECRVPPTSSPSDILVVVAGGQGWCSSILPGWGDNGGLAVTTQVRRRAHEVTPASAR